MLVRGCGRCGRDRRGLGRRGCGLRGRSRRGRGCRVRDPGGHDNYGEAAVAVTLMAIAAAPVADVCWFVSVAAVVEAAVAVSEALCLISCPEVVTEVTFSSLLIRSRGRCGCRRRVRDCVLAVCSGRG
jgi:hypothetical protein